MLRQERKDHFISLAKMDNCGADAALAGFTRSLNRVPAELHTSPAYDQGKKMARHAKLTKQLNFKVYFCDPLSPWQSPTNENSNGLIRQYLPKGIDLNDYSQRDLDWIAHALTTQSHPAARSPSHCRVICKQGRAMLKAAMNHWVFPIFVAAPVGPQ